MDVLGMSAEEVDALRRCGALGWHGMSAPASRPTVMAGLDPAIYRRTDDT